MNRRGIEGFTLLEVLVALMILGIAVTAVIRLFSASLGSIASSEARVKATARAESMMRELAEDPRITEEGVFSEPSPDGGRVDVEVTEVLQEKTEELPLRLMEISATFAGPGGKKSVTLRTQRLVKRQTDFAEAQ